MYLKKEKGENKKLIAAKASREPPTPTTKAVKNTAHPKISTRHRSRKQYKREGNGTET